MHTSRTSTQRDFPGYSGDKEAQNPCSEAELVLVRVPWVEESVHPSVEVLMSGGKQITYPERLTGPIDLVRLSTFGQCSGPGRVCAEQNVDHGLEYSGRNY